MKNRNVIVKKEGHSRVFLSGIYNACRYPQKEKTLLNECVEDPRQNSSGMTPNLMGFTLIELLVVVLIIAILAAVAVPQYQRAVRKAEMVEAYTFMDAVDKGLKALYLTEGSLQSFADKREEVLDIPLPQLQRWKYCLDVNCSSSSTRPTVYNVGNDSMIGNTRVGIKNTDIRIGAVIEPEGYIKWWCRQVNRNTGITDYDYCSKYVACDPSIAGSGNDRECLVRRTFL